MHASDQPILPCPFRIVPSRDHETLSRAAADAILDLIRRQPDALLILATGQSPARTYEILAAHGRSEPALFKAVRILKLDEWGGLAMDDPGTCETYLRRLLIDPLGIGPDRFVGYHSQPASPEEECARIREWLSEEGPADACILGVGLNGHLGLNEPAESLTLWPHRTELAAESRQHGMLRDARDTPSFGLTLGLADILNSNEILVLISGATKRTQLDRLLRPDISSHFPASMLWLHRRVTLFVDAQAAQPPDRARQPKG